MKNNKLIDAVIGVLIIFRLAVTLMPYVSSHSNNFLNMGSFFLLFFLLIIQIGIDKSAKFVSQYTPIFLICFLNIFVSIVRGESVIVSLYQFFLLLIWPLIIKYFSLGTSQKKLQFILVITLICYVITCITTYWGNSIYEEASRNMANGRFAENNPDLMNLYYSLNIGTYSFIYSLTILSPLVLYLFKDQPKYRLFSVIVSVAFLAVIVKTGFTTALLIYLISLAVLVLPHSFSMKDILKTGLLFLLIILVMAPVVAEVLGFISDSVGSEDVKDRITSLNIFLNHRTVEQGSDFESRLSLWQQSIEIFINSFPFGSLDKYGGHSLIFDNMARYGIIGIMCMIAVFRRTYKMCVRCYKQDFVYGYALFAYLINFIQCIINPSFDYFVMTFMIPLFALCFQQNDNRLNKYKIDFT